jgi:chromosome segregation ATPase
MEEKFSKMCEELSQQGMQASEEGGRLERELAYTREALENEANEKRSMEEKFSKTCEELSQQGMQASQEVDRLQGELQKSRTALDKANGESSLLSIDLAGFKSKLAMVEEALEQARMQSSEYEGELARAREALENEANEKRSMEEKFSKMCEELSQQGMQASEEVDRLQGELQAAQAALDSASGESSTLSIDLTGFKSKLAMVEEALEQARTQSSEYEGELARAREALENEANEKRSMEEKFSKMCEELSQQGMQASEEVDRLQGELQAAQAALDSAVRDSTEIRISADGYKMNLEAAQCELDALRSQSGDTSSDLTEYKNKVESLQSELLSAREDSMKTAEALSREQIKFQGMEEKLANIVASSGADNVEIETYKSRLASSELELETLRVKAAVNAEEAEKYQVNLIDAREEVARLADEIGEWKSKADSLEHQLGQVQMEHPDKDEDAEKNRQLEDELELLKEKVSASSAEIESYMGKLEHAESELSVMRAEIEGGKHERSEQNQEVIARMQIEVSAANERADRYKQRLLELEENMQLKLESLESIAEFSETEEVRLLQEQISRLESENAEANSMLKNMEQDIAKMRVSSIEPSQSPMWLIEEERRDMELSMLEARQAAQLSLAQVSQAVTKMRQQARGELVSHAISCEFKVRKDVGEHQFLCLVGSWHEWDVQTADYMQRGADGTWQVAITLFADEAYEYKYCVCEVNEHGQRVPIEWQVGHNHGFAFDSNLIVNQNMKAKAQIRDKFLADPAHTPIILFGPNGEKFETGSTALLHNFSNHIAESGFENLRTSLERLNAILAKSQRKNLEA